MNTNWSQVLVVALGGAAGSVARYLTGLWVHEWLDHPEFPAGTFLVNLGGSFLIGLLTHLAKTGQLLSPTLFLALTVGLLGGFTTFSTFSHDVYSLFAAGKLRLALAYLLASLACCILGVWLGYLLGHLLAPSQRA